MGLKQLLFTVVQNANPNSSGMLISSRPIFIAHSICQWLYCCSFINKVNSVLFRPTNPKTSAAMLCMEIGLWLFLQVVWTRKGLQLSCHGSAGTKSGRSLQFLFKAVYYEDSSHVSRSGIILLLWCIWSSSLGSTMSWVLAIIVVVLCCHFQTK